MIAATKLRVNDFLTDYKTHFDKSDYKYLTRSTNEPTDLFPKFYITAKVHKYPWKTRPIVSVSGSLLHGLGRWIDRILQPFAQNSKAFIKSSFQLKQQLFQQPQLPISARLFTADAVSMYTNIGTEHALRIITNYILTQPTHQSYEMLHAVATALEIVMTNNIFQFGDTYWIQLDGTAMGTPPAVTYATIYFSNHENELLTKYPELAFYRRYIDDIIGIWVPKDPTTDDDRWKLFQNDLNSFGKLTWEISTRTREVNYLDLTISLNSNQTITTDLYEKPHNLYLYLPANSNHPKGNLKGLIYGSLYRIHRLVSDPKMRQQHIQNLFARLLARGYDKTELKKAIVDAYHRYGTQPPAFSTATDDTEHTSVNENRVYFHIPFHPADPASNLIQETFRREIQHPRGLPPVHLLKNHKNAEIGINRLIVAYHRPPNIGNLLSPRIMTAENGPSVSSYLD
jgi:hypothetical protein